MPDAPPADPPAAPLATPPAAPSTTPPTTPADWRAAFPEALRDNPSLKEIPDIPTLAKRFIDTKALVGADTVAIPQKSWTDEQRRDFFNKIGCPEKTDGYVLPENVEMPQGFQRDDGLLDEMRQESHRLGLTDQQFAGVARLMLTKGLIRTDDFQHGHDTALEDTTQVLRKEWGTAYDQEIAFADVTLEKFGGEALLKEVKENHLYLFPELTKACAKIGHMIANDNILGAGPKSLMHTPESAQNAIGEKKRDKEFMKVYLDESAMGHAAAVDEMWALQKAAYPDKAPV